MKKTRVVKFVKVERPSLKVEIPLIEANYNRFRAKQGRVYCKDVKEPSIRFI